MKPDARGPRVRESLRENNTIENMERIFTAAKVYGFEVFISPHYFYPTERKHKMPSLGFAQQSKEASCDLIAQMSFFPRTFQQIFRS